jgi:hypothetical protein
MLEDQTQLDCANPKAELREGREATYNEMRLSTNRKFAMQIEYATAFVVMI